MENFSAHLGVFALAYLLGSIPFGLWLGKGIWNVDLRQHGSKNIGATNAWRTLGKVPGFIIFFCDYWKGSLAVYAAAAWAHEPWAMILAGVLAIVGHSASCFLGFRGGKGVATGLGVIAVLMPMPTVLVFLVWFLIVKFTGYVSLASIIAAILVPIFAGVFSYSMEYIIFGALAALLIVVRHKANIKRLMEGTESKIQAHR